MHKIKLIIGMMVMIIGSVFFVNEIWHGMIDERSYQECRTPKQLPGGTEGLSICHRFSDHIGPLLGFLGIIGVGTCFLVFGIRSTSFRES